MPSVARAGDTVLSPDGRGKNCAFPLKTNVGFAAGLEVNDRNVRVNGSLVPVFDNRISPHPKRGCSIDTSTVSMASGTVKIGGKGVARIGDKYGDNITTKGSPTVFAGG